jgi:hypothetical protein
MIDFSWDEIFFANVNSMRRETLAQKTHRALRRTCVNKRAMRDEDDDLRCVFTGRAAMRATTLTT